MWGSHFWWDVVVCGLTQGGAVLRQVRLPSSLLPSRTFRSQRCWFWLLHRLLDAVQPTSCFAGGADLMRIINHLRKIPFPETRFRSTRVGFESVNTGERRTSTTGDVSSVIQRSEQRGCCMCTCVCFLGGEWRRKGKAAIWNACVYVFCFTPYLWVTTGSVSPVWTTLRLWPKFS